MFKNYLKIAWRNLVKEKVISLINICGLSVGLAVATIVAFWVHDEVSFNRYHKNYDHITQIMQKNTINGDRLTLVWNPFLIGDVLKNKYGEDLKFVVMSSSPSTYALKNGEKVISKSGYFMDSDAPEMLSLHMLKGSYNALKDLNSIIISESLSKIFFGNESPIAKVINLDNSADLKITGVYEDLPYNSDFKDMLFVAPWKLFLQIHPGIKSYSKPWENDGFWAYVQLNDNANLDNVNSKIRSLKANEISLEKNRLLKPEVFLFPMGKWHLFSEFKNGVNIGGRIEFVWMFSIIGLFVLLIACINFINLSTANSYKRAREIGVRKVIGSTRQDLVIQFLIESIVITLISFFISILLVLIVLPSFNEVADKKVYFPWGALWYWLISIIFCLVTGVISGLYPAFYLASFQPNKVLKGSFVPGSSASKARKFLVGFQFTASMILIIGTVVVYRQVQFAKNRQIGYNSSSLITLNMTPEIEQHFEIFRDKLLKTRMVKNVAASTSPPTDWNFADDKFDWPGKDPNLSFAIPINNVTPEYGNTIGWNIKEGRDFSEKYLWDSSAFIMNEAAVAFMNLQKPIGAIVNWHGEPFHVIGVVRDIIFESPYIKVRPVVFKMTKDANSYLVIKLNAQLDFVESLKKVEMIYKQFSPNVPADFKFVNDEFNKKFGDEKRIGKLSGYFTFLAIFISFIGVFGLATFTAELRKKEIGVRKILGASLFNLWSLLTNEFLFLTLVAFVISVPLSYYFVSNWLKNYEYRASLPWWIFASAGLGSLLIILFAVTFQAIKSFVSNPLKTLRDH